MCHEPTCSALVARGCNPGGANGLRRHRAWRRHVGVFRRWDDRPGSGPACRLGTRSATFRAVRGRMSFALETGGQEVAVCPAGELRRCDADHHKGATRGVDRRWRHRPLIHGSHPGGAALGHRWPGPPPSESAQYRPAVNDLPRPMSATATEAASSAKPAMTSGAISSASPAQAAPTARFHAATRDRATTASRRR